MKATEAKLLDFLKKSPQFVIPIYQRTYSWTEKECRQLWDDIVRCGSSDKIAIHFVGSIVYIDDHPYLLTANMRPVFEAFRKAVLALDPCVSEEFLKRYVAYKAETNFVDVVPQARRLRLTLNMRFAEVNDPKGLCKDVTDIGRWGNGDAEIGLSNLDELPYVIGLVRQSLELQLGNGGES